MLSLIRLDKSLFTYYKIVLITSKIFRYKLYYIKFDCYIQIKYGFFAHLWK